MAEYDGKLSAAENQARALFEIANAIHKLLYALKYSQEEGLSVAEAIGDAGEKISSACSRD